MQKQTNIEAIKNCLRNNQVEQAVRYWQDSYHPISVEEFLECNDAQSNSDLLEEISSILQSLSLAHREISQQLEIQKPIQIGVITR